MSSESEPGDRAKSLGVRRSVELPETDVGAAEDLAPAADAEPAGESGGSGVAEEASGSPDADRASAGETGKSAESSAEKEKKAVPAPEVAVTPPSVSGATAADDEMPPDRPTKTALAAVAIGGAVVLAVPLLLIGTGSHHGKKHPTVAAAATVLPDGGQAPGAFASASPTVTPTPSPSKSPKAKDKGKDKDKSAAAKHAAAGAAKAGFRGAVNVLLKNTGTGMCADVPGYGAGKVDGPVNQYPCAVGGSDNQVWALGVQQSLKGPGGAPLFTVRNTKDDYCLDLPYYAAAKAGAKVTEYYCRPTKGDNQLWYRSHTSGSRYRIRNYVSHGLCLGVTGRSHATADKQLEIHSCGSGDEWSFPSGT